MNVHRTPAEKRPPNIRQRLADLRRQMVIEVLAHRNKACTSSELAHLIVNRGGPNHWVRPSQGLVYEDLKILEQRGLVQRVGERQHGERQPEPLWQATPVPSPGTGDDLDA